MRILHTSDWHLGKYLDGISRIEEQKKFCSDFVEIVKENNIDLILIAGDIYDTFNPQSIAEKLFYETVEKLSENGKRCVFVIAGNHDNPDRLEAVNPLAIDKGIIILGYPRSKTEIRKYDGFEIVESKEGFTKIKIKNEVINIISIPFPSEKRLDEAFIDFSGDDKMQITYSKKIGNIFSKLEENFNEDEINIATSHIFVVNSDISDSERRIELGGTLLVEKSDLPKKSQYTALGHIHKPQRISKELNIFYSGSPLQYSKSERISAKSVYIVDLKAKEDAKVEQIFLKNYIPIKVFKCKTIEEALNICIENKEKDIYAYFEIETDRTITQEEIKEMKGYIKNILEIRPIIKNKEFIEESRSLEINTTNINSYFLDYYRERENLEPNEEVIKLFNDLISEKEIEDEAY